MADLRETKVNITLAEYTRLVVTENDFDKVKAVIANAKDDYIGYDTTVLLKALCGIKGDKA